MAYKYSTNVTETCAKAVGLGLPISRKQSIMVCQALSGMKVPKAKQLLESVIAGKKAVPFTRFNKDMGHKPGMASGRYPIKTCTHILGLLKSAEANAQFKGLSTGNLVVKHASAQKGPTTMSFGRKRTQAKRTHIELVVEEIKEVKK